MLYIYLDQTYNCKYVYIELYALRYSMRYYECNMPPLTPFQPPQHSHIRIYISVCVGLFVWPILFQVWDYF